MCVLYSFPPESTHWLSDVWVFLLPLFADMCFFAIHNLRGEMAFSFQWPGGICMSAICLCVGGSLAVTVQ